MPTVKTPLYLRKQFERGNTKISWLNSYHTFSFGDYYEPNHRGFGPLRVINEDTVDPAKGFQTHGHQDMEIITYVLEGALEHKDSLGTGSVIYPGEVQKMSAGTGIQHSEFNHSQTDKVHFLQIWVLPEQKGVVPEYQQKKLVDPNLLNQWQLLCSPDGKDNSIRLYQDVALYTGLVQSQITYLPKQHQRKIWLQVAKGTVALDGYDCVLEAGDGVGLENLETELLLKNLEANTHAEVLLFDMI